MSLFRPLLLILLGIVLPVTELAAYQPVAYQYGGYAPAPVYQRHPPVWRSYPRPHQAPGMMPTWPVQVRQPWYGVNQTAPTARPEPDRKSINQLPKSTEKKTTQKRQKSTASGETTRNGSKQDFITALLPLVIKENQRLEKLRKEVRLILDGYPGNRILGKQEQVRLRKLARDYRIDGNPLESAIARQELLERIDIIPVSLTLAQAANESAWGTSRFAREGLNLFGIWTYDESKGMVPKNRPEGQKHLVRKFDTLQESVRYYMHTLNSHPAYTLLRDIRSERRNRNHTLDGLDLAEGLEAYSAKGKEYIKLIQQVIRQNELALLDNPITEA